MSKAETDESDEDGSRRKQTEGKGEGLEKGESGDKGEGKGYPLAFSISPAYGFSAAGERGGGLGRRERETPREGEAGVEGGREEPREGGGVAKPDREKGRRWDCGRDRGRDRGREKRLRDRGPKGRRERGGREGERYSSCSHLSESA